MNRLMVGGVSVFVSLSINVCVFTVSKAFDMSSATIIVLSGGCFLLKPSVIVFVMLCSAVVVE